MKENFILFDLDGVLLSSQGYPKALQDSVRSIASSLGLQNFGISREQIAKFEVLNVTNEWDTVAICTALNLIQCWKSDGSIRLGTNKRGKVNHNTVGADINAFLNTFSRGDDLPSLAAFRHLSTINNWLSSEQLTYLQELLSTCRDIYKSPTLPIHQEFILGSELFQEHYDLKPKSNIDGYLAAYDQPLLSPGQRQSLMRWLETPGNYAGIMTNRQSKSPPGYLSSPEAEIGIKLAGVENFPYIASGLLGWFAVTELGLPAYTLLKPNPVHALSLLRLFKGENFTRAIRIASDLWNGKSTADDWISFNNARITVYEDSVKGLQSAKSAQSLLLELGIHTKLNLIGVSHIPIKVEALKAHTDKVIGDICETAWPENGR